MKDPTKITAIPLELAAANEFVANLHRHHDPVYRDKFRDGIAKIDQEPPLHQQCRKNDM